ncbi:MAG: hypothetical protein ACREVW_00620 [Burkholderiales bacterium]
MNKVQLRSRDPEYMREVAPNRIEAAVKRIGQQSTGERIVTLDNNQVWLLTELTSKGHLAEGDRVIVREALMGSHMLLTPTRIALRTRRIR